MQIGAALRNRMFFLDLALAEIESTANGHIWPELQTLRNRLSEWTVAIDVVGPAGSGKSSLLRAMLGDSGSALVRGSRATPGSCRVDLAVPGMVDHFLSVAPDSASGPRHLTKAHITGRKTYTEQRNPNYAPTEPPTWSGYPHDGEPSQFLVPTEFLETSDRQGRAEAARNLKVDIVLVVLPAAHLTAEAALAAIKPFVLRGRRDFVIFVNKIDEVPQMATSIPALLDHLSSRVAAEFANIDCAVLAGSALLAEFAGDDCAGSALTAAEKDTPELSKYLRATYQALPLRCKDRLALASGLDTLKLSLGRAMDRGRAAERLVRLQRDLRSQLVDLEQATRNELICIEKLSPLKQGADASLIGSEIAALLEARAQVDGHLKVAAVQMSRAKLRSQKSLAGQLDDAVAAYFSQSGQFSGMHEGHGQTLETFLTARVTLNLGKFKSCIEVILSNAVSACRHALGPKFVFDFNVLQDEPLSDVIFLPPICEAGVSYTSPSSQPRSRKWWLWNRLRSEDRRSVSDRDLALVDIATPLRRMVLDALAAAQDQYRDQAEARLTLLRSQIELRLAHKRKRWTIAAAHQARMTKFGETDLDALRHRLAVLRRQIEIMTLNEGGSENGLAPAA